MTVQGSDAGSEIIISSFDKQRLLKLLNNPVTFNEDRDEMEDLIYELERGVEVAPREVPAGVVTMNSIVRVTNVDTNETLDYTLVFPWDADYSSRRISVLAPLGTALLGYSIGDVVEWEVPAGVRRLRIDAILYQPEAAGDFHL